MKKRRVLGLLLAGMAVLALGICAAQGAGMVPAAGKGRLAAVEAAAGKVFRERTVLLGVETFLAEAGTVQEGTVRNETRPGQTDDAEMAMPETDETATLTEEQREGDAETEEPSSQKEQPSVSEPAETSPVEPAAGSTGNHSGTGSSGSTGGGSYSGSTSGDETSGQPVHIHTWEEQTTTVMHEASGHYETKVIREAWEEGVWKDTCICLGCGHQSYTAEEAGIHCAFCETGKGYTVRSELIDTIHHEAETEQVWVEDSPAWAETVVTGYKCSGCGITK